VRRNRSAQRLEILVGQDLAGAQEPLGAQVELDELDPETVADRVEHLQGLADDLGPGPVAADHPDPVIHGVGSSAPVALEIWSARLTAARYARALASTTSVATPRPVTRRPSTSSCTTTSPRASVPPVTALTL